MNIQQNIHYKVIGQGPPLVFIHGILGFWRNFYSIGQELKNNYTVILYDQRGHGRSFHQEPYTLKHLAGDLKELLNFLKYQPVTLIGHSLGAYVSYVFASQYPEYVKQIVAVDGSPWPLESSRKKIENILSKLPLSFTDRIQANLFFKQAVAKKNLSQPIANLLMSSLEKNTQDSVKFLFDIPGLLNFVSHIQEEDWTYASAIKSLKIPLLILRGKKSTHFLKSDFEKTLKLNPLIIGKEIEDSGHWIHAEQPQKFMKALKEFLI